jgi:putative DNA primase/helicase
MHTQAEDIEERRERSKAQDHARKSESAKAIRDMISCAEAESGITISVIQLDSDAFLLNCLNGTVDLRSGHLREHRREDLITKLAPVQYDPKAQLDLWDELLDWVTAGNRDLRKYLQRAGGYSITGDGSEEVLFLVHGDSSTGKSTFLEALKMSLGDYARTADFEAFLKRHQVGAPRNDIARLAGARMVISIEVDEGKRLAEGLIKMLTGGDTVAARFLYKEAFEFLPGFKLWLAANHAPEVRDDDEAMWRRIRRIPFDHVIPKTRRDPKVKATLKNPSVAGPAILAWAVRGAVMWQEQGLGVPPIVEQATAAYREEMNPISEFINDCCLLAENAGVGRTALFEAYEEWAAGKRVVLDRKRFDERIGRLGCERTRKGKNGDRVWTGIELRKDRD